MSMRSFAVLSAILLLTSVLNGCGGANARYERYMERGKNYLEAGDLDKAKIEFKNAMQIAPKSAEARYEAGVVAQRALDLRAALGLYQGAIDLRPDYPEARAKLAHIFVMGAAPERGMAIVAEGLAKHPDNVELLVVRAAAQMQLKKPAEARADAERAAQLDPGDESAAALRAALLRADNDSAKAIEVIEAALKLKPAAIDLRRILADLRIERGELDAAEVQLREVVKREPKQLALRYELANFHVRQGNLDQAQKTLEGAVDAAPDDDDAKLVLANMVANHRSAEQGEAILRAFVKKDPDNMDLRMGLGALLERMGSAKAALVEYQEIIAQDRTGPMGLTARNRVAAYEVGRGNLAEGEKLLGEILKDNPRDLEALGMRASVAAQRGNPGAAIVDLRAVLRDMPDSAQAYRMLARAHIANGEPALAEEALRKAVELRAHGFAGARRAGAAPDAYRTCGFGGYDARRCGAARAKRCRGPRGAGARLRGNARSRAGPHRGRRPETAAAQEPHRLLSGGTDRAGGPAAGRCRKGVYPGARSRARCHGCARGTEPPAGEHGPRRRGHNAASSRACKKTTPIR